MSTSIERYLTEIKKGGNCANPAILHVLTKSIHIEYSKHVNQKVLMF